MMTQASLSNSSEGVLYIVPTPIGNLEDMSFRAVRILKEVDLICAEDTRHSKKLLNHFGIGTRLFSYYREKEQAKSEHILTILTEGKSVALISDAGTPAISDPGAILVKKAHDAGIPVVPLPGPSAATTALSASGFQENGFLFLGFPPVKKGQRTKFIESFSNSNHPVVLYESPRRITELLTSCIEILGKRDGLLARELSKSFEQLTRGTLTELLEASKSKTKGEFVLIIGPGQKEGVTADTLLELLFWYRDNSELSVKDVSRKLADDLGESKSKIYQLAVSVWQQK